MTKTSLDIPGSATPSNLRLPESAQAVIVESDMYNICNRVKDISPSLFIVLLTDNTKYAYAIMESCKDGVDRLVYKVKDLDARVLDRLAYMMKFPLNERMKQLEKDEHRMAKSLHEDSMEELYERMGEPMKWQLVKDGFASRSRFYSRDYNKRNK
jgi:hypothetical protein